jgi:hypothetical protein
MTNRIDLLKLELVKNDSDNTEFLDFFVCSGLTEYLKKNGYEGKKEILAQLGLLAYLVQTEYNHLVESKKVIKEK